MRSATTCARRWCQHYTTRSIIQLNGLEGEILQCRACVETDRRIDRQSRWLVHAPQWSDEEQEIGPWQSREGAEAHQRYGREACLEPKLTYAPRSRDRDRSIVISRGAIERDLGEDRAYLYVGEREGRRDRAEDLLAEVVRYRGHDVPTQHQRHDLIINRLTRIDR